MGGGEYVLVGDEGAAAVLGVVRPPQKGSHPRPVLGVGRFPAHDAIKERLLRVDATACEG